MSASKLDFALEFQRRCVLCAEEADLTVDPRLEDPADIGCRRAATDRPGLPPAWVAAMVADGLSASRMGQAKRVVSAVLAQAVDDGLIGRNAAEAVKLPRTRERDQRYLTVEQVTELADAVEQRMRGGAPLVKLLAYGGLLWGEAVALRSNNVDVLGRRVHVRESANLVNGKLV